VVDVKPTAVSRMLYWQAQAWLYLHRFVVKLRHTALITLVFLLLATTGLFLALPLWLHIGCVVAVLGFIANAVIKTARTLPLPTLKEAEQQIERASRLKHQPFAVQKDTLSQGKTPLEQALWQLHQTQAKSWLSRKLKSIRFALKTRILISVQYSTAIASVAILSCVLVLSPAARKNITETFRPAVAINGVTTLPPITGWIEPPAYTGLTAITLPADEREINVPQGSILKLTAPHTILPLAVKNGGDTLRFIEHSEDDQQLNTPLTASGAYRLKNGLLTAAPWNINVIADLAPKIALNDKIILNQQGSLTLPFSTSDDYGVVTIAVVLTPAKNQPHQQTLYSWDTPLKTLTTQATADFSDLPFAGQNVALSLIATDSARQTTTTAPVTIPLPERVFTHPVAKHIIETRKKLLNNTHTPPKAVAILSVYLQNPAPIFQRDFIAYLSFVSALQHLIIAHNPVESAAVLLWQTAVRLEQGSVGREAENMRQAADKLRELLANPNRDAEALQQALKEFAAALEKYIQSIAAQQTPKGAPPPDVNMSGLQKYLESIENLANSGKPEDALKRLDSLQQMMENLQNPQEMSPQLQKSLALLEDMQNLTQAQRNLLKKTGETKAPTELEKLSQAQQQLIPLLQKIMAQGKGLNMPLEGLNQALEAMQQSLKALSGQQQQQSLDAQHEAVNALEKTLQKAAKQLQEQNPSLPFPSLQGAAPQNPLNSRYPVPDAAEANQLRQLMQTIQDKLPQSEGLERQYLRGLLGGE
jgi:uncharacterized protein (TIGR02302 family)